MLPPVPFACGYEPASALLILGAAGVLPEHPRVYPAADAGAARVAELGSSRNRDRNGDRVEEAVMDMPVVGSKRRTHVGRDADEEQTGSRALGAAREQDLGMGSRD